MTISNLTITVTAASGAESSTAERWLRLTTDPPDKEEGVSKAELAAMLDNLIGITDHCSQDSVPAEDIDNKIKQKLGGQASCQTAAERLKFAEKCSPARRAGLAVKKNVYVHWSWYEAPPSENYRLIPLGSAIVLSGPLRSAKTVKLVIDVTNLDSAPVRYHADEAARIALWRKQPPRWIGKVLVGKKIVAGPEIGWSNGKVVLGATVSGRLEMWLPIIFDTWTISIPGVYLGDGKRSYTAKVLGVSELLNQPAELEIEDETEGDPDAEDCSACGGSSDAVPDDQIFLSTGDDGDGTGTETGIGLIINGNPVYCYIRIDWTLVTQCTGKQVDSGTEYLQVECPKDENITPTYNIGFDSIKELPDYIYEVGSEEQERYTGEGETGITDAEDKNNCCCNPADPRYIAQCKTRKSTYSGTTWPLVEKDLKDQYDGETNIVYVGPRSGVCGTRTDEMVVPDNDCCDDVTELSPSPDNPDVISSSVPATIGIVGGKSLYTWEISDDGFYFSASENIKKIITSATKVTVYAESTACGSCDVNITDSCKQTINIVLRCTNGKWVLIEEEGIFNGAAGQFAECINGKYKIYEDYCGRILPNPCPGGCTGKDDYECQHPPYPNGEICTAEGWRKWEWTC